ncbi:hypothetical protein EPI10_031365 [Gossypium australe]|uniref:Uncharacterized protein n=1 Tax=Gossypium australe TaxID=47621 RepID=A0A5B6X191_9ROSI|nr:hypothetical protein EPI10_031365 [Gossypium australe]
MTVPPLLFVLPATSMTWVATFLHLPIEVTTQFYVLVDNGDRLQCRGIFRQIPLVIQGQEIHANSYVLVLKG